LTQPLALNNPNENLGRHILHHLLLLLQSATDGEEKLIPTIGSKTDQHGLGDRFILTSISPWLDLTKTKQRRGWRNFFHDDEIISALMSPSGNINLHVATQKKLLTLLSPPSSELPWREPSHPHHCCQRGEGVNNLTYHERNMEKLLMKYKYRRIGKVKPNT
jgi:hypothetical protein